MTSSYKGKMYEYRIISMILEEGYECFLPIVDDNGIDVIVKKNKKYNSVQIKGRSKDKVTNKDLFLIKANKDKADYYVFYSELNNKIWLLKKADLLNFHKKTNGDISLNLTKNICNLVKKLVF